jgi:hypothetical protein
MFPTKPCDLAGFGVVVVMGLSWFSTDHTWSALKCSTFHKHVGIGTAVQLSAFLFRKLRVSRAVRSHVLCVAPSAVGLPSAIVLEAAFAAMFFSHIFTLTYLC